MSAALAVNEVQAAETITMAAGALKVAGRTVTTDSATAIRDGNAPRTFSDLAIGQRVHVSGRSSATALLASSIVIQNVITTIPVIVNGDVELLRGTASDFQFKGGATLVKGDSDTEKNGDKVQVKGTSQADNNVVATTVKKK